jgi:S-adenosylmethionine decarboxylase
VGKISFLNQSVIVEQNAEADAVGNRHQWPTHLQTAGDNHSTQDHFISRDGKVFAGVHLILDFWGASRLDDLERMEAAFRECVAAANATLLHIHLHCFEPNGGISGVAVLAESHISVHTWPERNYAAFDVFMCGDARPENTIPVLQRAFQPERVLVTEHRRGEVHEG